MNFSLLDTILNFVERIIKIAREYPFFTSVFSIVLFVATILWFTHDEFAYRKPARVIEEFYDKLNSQDYKGAFSLLSSKYADKRFNNNLNKFTEGYLTTKRHTNLIVNFVEETSKGLLRDFTVLDKEYTITFEAEDVFKYDDLKKNIGFNNSDILWLQTYKTKRIENIINPSISSYSLSRYFKKKIKLFKEQGEWKIDEMQSLEIGIRTK